MSRVVATRQGVKPAHPMLVQRRRIIGDAILLFCTLGLHRILMNRSLNLPLPRLRQNGEIRFAACSIAPFGAIGRGRAKDGDTKNSAGSAVRERMS